MNSNFALNEFGIVIGSFDSDDGIHQLTEFSNHRNLQG